MSGGSLPSAKPRRIEVIANTASGSVGPGAPDELRALFAELGLEARIHAPEGDLEACIKEALARAPDLLVILAGDGTARAAAALAGPEGPLLATLPGGTMNMLPKALYGQRTWQAALRDSLENGMVREVSGGEVDGNPFHCAAILGAPAFWAPAREAARHGRFKLAFARARLALKRAFNGPLRYALEGGVAHEVEALSLICPLISRALAEDEPALEFAALNPKGAADAVRLGLHAALGDWRADPNVKSSRARRGMVWAKGRIPAILDGETIRLGRSADIRFKPVAFRALVPIDPAEEPASHAEIESDAGVPLG